MKHIAIVRLSTGRVLAALVVLGTLLGAAREARAAAISYSLTLCESEAVLNDPHNVALQQNAAWKPQHQLMLDRTTPYLELRNTSAEASITQLSLSIGDLSKNFDIAKLVEASPGVSFSLVGLDSAAGGLKSDTLLINFTGLDPGEYVRFRLMLSPDDSSASKIVDYRQTLFQLNGGDSSNNAEVDVTFTSSLGEAKLSQFLRDYEFQGPTGKSLAFRNNNCGLDHIEAFNLTQAGVQNPPTDPDDDLPGEDVPVPEPGSVALLAIGLATLGAWRFKRRVCGRDCAMRSRR